MKRPVFVVQEYSERYGFLKLWRRKRYALCQKKDDGSLLELSRGMDWRGIYDLITCLQDGGSRIIIPVHL